MAYSDDVGSVRGKDGGPRRRQIAASLRRMRVAAGLTEQDVAAYLELQLSRFVLIEKGLAVIRAREVRTILDLYGVAGRERDELLDAVGQLRARCWWYPYADLIDENFETQLILEGEAAVIRTYQPNLVPGLLQTERYAWELIATQADLPLDRVHRQARLRAMRRQILNRADAPRLDVILDEAALRRPVGSQDVMREQYRRLAAGTDIASVNIQVHPFQAGPHQGMGLGFHIYEFADGGARVVELELLDRVHFVEESRDGDAQEVAHYMAAFARASSSALDAEGSRAFLEELSLTTA